MKGFFSLLRRLLRDEEGSYLLYMTLAVPECGRCRSLQCGGILLQRQRRNERYDTCASRRCRLWLRRQYRQ
jgi:hypothetical protein